MEASTEYTLPGDECWLVEWETGLWIDTIAYMLPPLVPNPSASYRLDGYLSACGEGRQASVSGWAWHPTLAGRMSNGWTPMRASDVLTTLPERT